MNENILRYIFFVLAFVLLYGAFQMSNQFESTQKNIELKSLDSNIEHIDNITDNISNLIKKNVDKDIYLSLKEHPSLRTSIEQSLEVFITKRYRYVYVVDKLHDNSSQFRFLLDGAKSVEDKSEFEELYTPLNIKEWNRAYQTKKTVYFKHQDSTALWITYLKPIILNNQVEAIIVIDFSLQTHNMILNLLGELYKSFDMSIIFAIITFLVIILFGYIDNRRKLQKEHLFNELEKKSQEILGFNKTLQERVNAEVHKNREKDKQMIEQSRFAQMGEMISMIAHQWRQPLSAISSTSSAIKLKATLDTLDKETTLDLADKISQYSQHLSTTINDFREFFKSNKEQQETSLDRLVEGALSIIEVSINNKNIKIVKDLHSPEIITTYANEMKQVILNLIKNAEDILIEKEIKDAEIRIKSYKNTQFYVIEVEDNGGGIPQEIISKIFDPYFSTKLEKNGTGLGLYMSKTIIEEHCRGKLSVSNNNQGAIFKIELERNEEIL